MLGFWAPSLGNSKAAVPPLPCGVHPGRRSFSGSTEKNSSPRTVLLPGDFKSDLIQPFSIHLNHYQTNNQAVDGQFRWLDIILDWQLLNLTVPPVSQNLKTNLLEICPYGYNQA
jgi:hypothetical protein